MLSVVCPHCGERIELAGAGEIEEQFGHNPNQLQYLRDNRERLGFPEPFIALGNRYLYLGDELREYFQRRQDERLEKEVRRLADLSLEERRKFAQRVMELPPPDDPQRPHNNNNPTPRKTRR